MWQELGLDPEGLGALPGRFVYGVLVPQILFFLGLRQEGLAVALVLSGGWSLVLQLYELWRRHSWNPFLIYGLIFTVMQGAAALYTQSPAVYAARGIAEDLLGSVVFFGSIAVRHPLLVELLGSVSGGRAVMTLPVQRALWRLTILWALLFLTRSMGLYAALTHLPIGQFLLINTLTGWPLNGMAIVLSLLYVRTQLRLLPRSATPDPILEHPRRSDHSGDHLRPSPAVALCRDEDE